MGLLLSPKDADAEGAGRTVPPASGGGSGSSNRRAAARPRRSRVPDPIRVENTRLLRPAQLELGGVDRQPGRREGVSRDRDSRRALEGEDPWHRRRAERRRRAGDSTLEPARAARTCASMGCQTRAGRTARPPGRRRRRGRAGSAGWSVRRCSSETPIRLRSRNPVASPAASATRTRTFADRPVERVRDAEAAADVEA